METWTEFLFFNSTVSTTICASKKKNLCSMLVYVMYNLQVDERATLLEIVSYLDRAIIQVQYMSIMLTAE
jgi:hypothetical protein